jgi:hypothetical protein
MNSRVSRLSRLMTSRNVDAALRIVQNYETIVAANVVVGSASSCKVVGTILHVAKCKKVSFVQKSVSGQGDKKTRREAVYHRLVFCR